LCVKLLDYKTYNEMHGLENIKFVDKLVNIYRYLVTCEVAMR